MIGVVSVRNPKQKRIIGFQNIIGLLYSVSIAAAAAYIPLSAAAAAYIPLSAAAAAANVSAYMKKYIICKI
jgi:hypothetical protein